MKYFSGKTRVENKINTWTTVYNTLHRNGGGTKQHRQLETELQIIPAHVLYNRIQHTTPTQQRNYTTQKIPRHSISNKYITKENDKVQYQSSAWIISHLKSTMLPDITNIIKI